MGGRYVFVFPVPSITGGRGKVNRDGSAGPGGGLFLLENM